MYFVNWGDSIATKRLLIGDAEVPKKASEQVDGGYRIFNASWSGSDYTVVGHYLFEKIDSENYSAGINRRRQILYI